MEKFNIGTIRRSDEKYGQAIKFIGQNFLLLSLFSFLLGRATILDELMPFGIAIFSSLIAKDKKNVPVAIFSVLGILTVGINIYRYIISIALIYITFRYFLKTERNNVFKNSFITASITLLVGVTYIFVTNFYLYDLFMVLFESIVVFVFMYILSYAIPILNLKNSRKVLSNEEIICLAIVLGVGILGLSNISVLRFSLKTIIGLLIIILFAYNGGASIGSGVGVTIGVITSMSTIGTPVIIGIYSFSGLLAGIFRDMGKIACGIGLLLGNSILTFYINGATEAIVQFEEVIIAVFIFLIMPQRYVDYISKFINSKTSLDKFDKVYSERMKRFVLRQLDEYSLAFSELADTYSQIADKEKIVEQKEITEIVNNIANSICAQCSMKRSCWNNNFYSTYNGLIDAITILEAEGKLNEKNLPSYLSKRCIKTKELINIINGAFEIYKVDYKWSKKMLEMRQLVSEQFSGVSEIIKELSENISINISFNKEVEDALYVAFDKEKIIIDNITVMENSEGKYEISIEKKNCYNRQNCENLIIPIVSKVIGKELMRKNTYCKTKEKDSGCIIQLVEAQKYKVNTGVAKISKENSSVSGDNYSFMDIPDNKYMVALSDGMGTGEKAARESMATITLLENLMEAGFNKDITIKTVNSVLMSKSLEEAFSTIDLSMIDLHNGRGEFIKIGAAPSFIKRSNGKVEIIEASSLPVGIIDNIIIDSKSLKLEDGDYIIMMSDGVLDADKNFIDKTNWMKEVIKGIGSRNPQGIADEILNTAIERNGKNIEDDMSVIVTKVWKRK